MGTNRLLDGRLKLRHLILVDALTENGSVVGAASALHITQPVVTRGLHDLEQILGVPLYERSSRGIIPTEFGEAFTDHARSVLAQLTQAARHVEEIADAKSGNVVVGSHLAGSNLLLPHAIAKVKADKPMLTVIVRQADPDSLLVELSAGRVDLILGRLRKPSSDNVQHRLLYQESIKLFVGTDHPLGGKTRVTISELFEYPWILPGSETALRRELERFFADNGHDLPRNRVEATSYLTVRQLLLETQSIAALPALIGWDDKGVTPLPLNLSHIGHHVGIKLARGRRLNPATRIMIQALDSVANQLRDEWR